MMTSRPPRLFRTWIILAACLAATLEAQLAGPTLINLSARGRVGAGEDVLVAGFVIAGQGMQRVLVRAAGPALGEFGLTTALASPRIRLYAGADVAEENAGWDAGENATEIATAAARAGAFAFPAGSADSAVIATLAPGAYTAVVSGVGSATGVALLEVYTLEPDGTGVVTPENLAAVEDIVDAALASYEIPGIIYAIKYPGAAPITNARGVRSLETGEPLQPDDYFRIGSASKTFVGMAALRLIEQNKLEFETTVAAMLPSDVLSNYARDEITVRMLLQHTSGINNYTNDIEDWFFPYILDRTRIWTNAELVELVNAKFTDPMLGKVFNPGAGWYYSNTNTVLLAMIVEKVTGRSIRQVLREEFFQPLGLSRTIYPMPGESEMPEPYARGYMNWANFTGESSLPSTLLDVSTYDPSGVGPAGPIVSTAGDLAIWMEAVATNEEVSGAFLRGHIDWKYFVSFAGGEPGAAVGSYGMNIAHEPDPNNNADYWIVGHRGQLSGYDTAMMYLPEQKVSLVLMCTRSLKFGPNLPSNALTAALNDIIAVLYPDLIADSQLPAAVRSMARDAATTSRVGVPLKEY